MLHTFPKQTTIPIPKSEGKRYAVSDIHGCGKTFIQLIEHKLGFTHKDQLFILGDVIDRGKNSLLVLDWIIEKREQGFQIYTLMGNHEQMLIDFYLANDNYFSKATLSRNHLEDLVDETGKIKKKYQSYFDNLILYIELDTCLLVHAGFNLKHEEGIFQDKNAMLWMRKFKGNYSKTYQKPVVYGHQVHSLDQIMYAIIHKLPQIPIDNGCVYVYYERYKKFRGEVGNLVALDVDSFQLHYLANQE